MVDGVRICQTGGKVPPRALRYSFPWTLGGSLRDAPQWLYFSNECGVDRGVSRWETPLLHRGRPSVTLFTLPDSRPIPNLRYTSLCANPTGHSPGLRRTIMCPSAPRDGMESVPPDHYSGCTYLGTVRSPQASPGPSAPAMTCTTCSRNLINQDDIITAYLSYMSLIQPT